ncbi:Polyadenylate-binding protein RBP45 [Platanthera guangdongensis]|uniref:Polyadenylate-binding protein RBP45 n=1 Tax=Platanthera guangdongensis TaxID=2320717 RepID=A0ABR2MXC0_9ASPA
MMHPNAGMIQQPPMDQQQWTMMHPGHHPQYAQAHSSNMWNQPPSQIPPPAQVASLLQQQQQQQQQFPQQHMLQYQTQSGFMASGQMQQQQQSSHMSQDSSDEIRTLWIGDLQYWMDENYIFGCFAQTGEVLTVKIIRNKQTQQSECYGFIEFASRLTAQQVLQTYNGQVMPNSEQVFRMNWASLGSGEKRGDDDSDYTIFVGDLASDVTDYMLQETFKTQYPSVRGAKIVTDRATGRSKGYGFVKFGDLNEQTRAMTEMNGMFCSSRPMRIGPAANKNNAGIQQQTPSKAPYQNQQGSDSENDPNNTTIFVGGLDSSVTDDLLRQVFSTYGELVHVKIPLGKRCGFVQFANRGNAVEALQMLNGTLLGGQNIRLSWGRSPPNKQTQQEQNQWNGNYYGYSQGYNAYGYAPPQQNPNMYAYASYPGYANYQQHSNHQQQ